MAIVARVAREAAKGFHGTTDGTPWLKCQYGGVGRAGAWEAPPVTFDADCGDIGDSAYLSDASGPKGGGGGHRRGRRGRGYGRGGGVVYVDSGYYLEPDPLCLDALGRPIPCPPVRQEASGPAEDWHVNMAALLRRLPSYARLSQADQVKALEGIQWMAHVMGDAVSNRKNLAYTHQNLVAALRASPFWMQKFSPADVDALQYGIATGFAGANEQRGQEKSLLGKIGGAALGAVPYAQAVLSFVPGIGTGVSAALGAASALAQGQSITDAALAAARGALPGGPVAQTAFDVGLSIAKGASPTEAALAAARARVPGGIVGQKAFDVAVAMGRAQAIQRGAPSMGAIAGSVREAISQGRPVTAADPIRAHQVRTVGAPMANVLPSGVQTATAALLGRPELRSLPLATVASKLALSPSTLRQAYAAICGTMTRVGSPELKGLLPRLALHPEIEAYVHTGESLDAFLSRHGSHAVRSVSYNGTGGKRAVRARGFSPALVAQLVARHASVRQLSPAAQKALVTTEAGALDAGGATYTVDKSDYGMAQIAKKLGVTLSQLAAANPQIKDINKIYQGQKINVPGAPVAPPQGQPPQGQPPSAQPPASSSGTYVVKSGDTFGGIAKKYGVTVSALAANNPQVKDINKIYVGQVLTVPGGTSSTPPQGQPPATSSGTYMIRSGDTGYGLAQRATGNGGRWKEILAANPTLKTYTMTVNGVSDTQITPWNIGQTINVPAGWNLGGSAAPPQGQPPLGKPPQGQPPGPVTPKDQPPASSAAIVQVQVMLTNWNGLTNAAICKPSDFGESVADLSGVLTQRTSQAVQSFQIWWDAAGGDGTQLRTDGVVDDATMGALQKYTAKNAPPVKPPPPGGPPFPGAPPPGAPPKKDDGGGGLIALAALAALAFA